MHSSIKAIDYYDCLVVAKATLRNYLLIWTFFSNAFDSRYFCCRYKLKRDPRKAAIKVLGLETIPSCYQKIYKALCFTFRKEQNRYKILYGYTTCVIRNEILTINQIPIYFFQNFCVLTIDTFHASRDSLRRVSVSETSSGKYKVLRCFLILIWTILINALVF